MLLDRCRCCTLVDEDGNDSADMQVDTWVTLGSLLRFTEPPSSSSSSPSSPSSSSSRCPRPLRLPRLPGARIQQKLRERSARLNEVWEGEQTGTSTNPKVFVHPLWVLNSFWSRVLFLYHETGVRSLAQGPNKTCENSHAWTYFILNDSDMLVLGSPIAFGSCQISAA